MGAEPRRVEPWPLALAAALLTMIGVSLAFVRVAITHPDALLVRDAYASEPAVAEALWARDRARAQGWTLAVRTRAEQDGVRVEAELRDAQGAALEADRVRVRRERPAEGGLDAELLLARDGHGFTGHVPLPRGGRWTLTVQAERQGGQIERRLALRGPG